MLKGEIFKALKALDKAKLKVCTPVHQHAEPAAKPEACLCW